MQQKELKCKCVFDVLSTTYFVKSDILINKVSLQLDILVLN